MYKKQDYSIDAYKDFVELCRIHSNDEVIYVAKAISWALRRIGRLNAELYNLVYETSKEISFLKSNYSQLIYEEVFYELNDGMIKSMIL